MRISLISGGFDPIHRGHINNIRAAKEIRVIPNFIFGLSCGNLITPIIYKNKPRKVKNHNATSRVVALILAASILPTPNQGSSVCTKPIKANKRQHKPPA